MSTSARIVRPGLFIACALASLLLAAPAGAARITLLGTTVQADGVKPTVGARVTLWPQGITTWSDRDGDFLIDWDGARGWLTFVPPDSMLTGTVWCKRLVLHPAEDAAAGTKDLGMIRVTGRARLTYQTQLSLPPDGGRPDSLNLPGPAPGEPDSCYLRLHLEGDIWGRVTTLEQLDGNKEPRRLVEAILEWERNVAWVVPAESSCEADPPFSSVDEIRYVWSGTTWKRFDPVENRLEQVRRQREARERARETKPR